MPRKPGLSTHIRQRPISDPDVVRHLLVGTELEEVLAEIVAAGIQNSHADRGAIYIYDAEHDRLTVGGAQGLSPDYLSFLTEVFHQVPGSRLLREPGPIIIQDAWNDPEARVLWEAARREGFRSYVVLPLAYRQKVLGALVFYSNQRHSWGPEEMRFYQALADQAALVLAHLSLSRQTQRWMDILAAFREVDQRILSTHNLEEVLWVIAGTIQRVLGVSTLYIGLYDGVLDELHVPVMIDRGERQPPLHLKLSEEAGLAGWVIRTGQPLWINDTQQEELPVPAIRIGDPTRSLAVLPLEVHNRIVGVLSAQSYLPYAFQPEDRWMLEGIAAQAAIAIENVRLLQESRQRAAQLEMAAEVARAAASILDVRRLLSETAELVRERFNLYYVGIFLLDESGRWAVLRAGTGEAGRKMLEMGHKLRVGGPSMIGWCTAYGKPRIALDVGKEAVRFDNPLLPATRSEMALPLLSRERVIGAMTIQSDRPAAFTPEDVTVLKTVADQLATAIENAHLYQESLRRQAQAWVLREVMLAAASTLDFDQVLQRTIQTLRAALGVEFLAVILPDESGSFLRVHPSQIGYTLPAESFRIPLDRSVSGMVFQTGRAMLIGDVRAVPFYYEGHPEVRSEVCVPLRVGTEVIGVLNVESRQPNAFREEDLVFFTAIAGELAIALENARLYQREQRRREEAESLYRAALAMTTSLDLREVLERILTELQRVVPYDSASVQLLHDGKLEIIAGRGFPNTEELLGVTIDPAAGDNPNAQVIRTREPLILEDAQALYERFRQPPHAAADIHAWMGVPLLYGDRVIGMLTVDKHEPGFYTREHARVATAFAGQAAIAMENARLYQQLEEQSAELTVALRRLQNLDRLRDQMIQNVGHELRTPLTLIQGYVELLLNDELGTLHPLQRSALQVVYERTQTLARLIGNLTALRSVRPEAMRIAPIAVPEGVALVVEHYARRARNAGIEIVTRIPVDLPLILADQEHFLLALSQLVDNAIKFSPQGGVVQIRAWAEGEWVKIAVQDEGVGIPEEHLSHIFERFYQVNGSTTRRFGGMGIGLALVWEIMEAHCGSVQVESEVGKGSTFTLSFRRAGEMP
ncbi:MAG: GAF domain-containing protein [Anaerolineae bacterium]|nr:GAF domain-containing protein [Anaerolineae bacterium]MDW8067861.1 GAF domain-containing protein [Anaerolineae bacterium]